MRMRLPDMLKTEAMLNDECFTIMFRHGRQDESGIWLSANSGLDSSDFFGDRGCLR